MREQDFSDFDSILQLMNFKEIALEEYHETCKGIDARIEEIRKKRGVVLKVPTSEGFHERGRDQHRKNGNW